MCLVPYTNYSSYLHPFGIMKQMNIITNDFHKLHIYFYIKEIEIYENITRSMILKKTEYWFKLKKCSSGNVYKLKKTANMS